MGRKTKYKKKYCKENVELGAKGWSIWRRAYHFNICEKTYNNWVNTFIPFAESHALAETAKRAFWERDAAENPDRNAQEKKIMLVYHNDYTEKKQVKQETDNQITTINISVKEPPQRYLEEKENNNVIDVTDYERIEPESN